MLVDSHCHIDVAEFDADRDAVIAAARAAGVGRMVVPGVRLADFATQKAVCDTHAGLHAAYGLHPVYLDDHRDDHLAALRDWLLREKPVAVGEIGLDGFVEGLDRGRQQALFEAQLALAAELDLPVILHVRRTHDDVLATLRRVRVPRGGICHAFAGSLDQAKRYADLGFLLGFGGAATHDRANRLRATLQALPLSTIALETDAPDIRPCFVPAGGRNSPEYLPRIAAILAEVKGVDVAELAAATTRNVSTLFRLPAG